MSFASNHNQRDALIALIDLFHAMWNTHDVAGVLGCFSEEAVVRIVCPEHDASVVYREAPQFRAFVE